MPEDERILEELKQAVDRMTHAYEKANPSQKLLLREVLGHVIQLSKLFKTEE